MKDVCSPLEKRYLSARAAHVLRETRGISLAEIAKLLGVKEGYLKRAVKAFPAIVEETVKKAA